MPRTIAHIVDKVARAGVGKDWPLYAALLEHWQEIVGAEYARVTSPVKIAFPHRPLEPARRNGVLTVRLPKGLAMEFTFRTEQVKQRVNDYFGYEAIGRILLDPVFAMPSRTKQPVAEPDAATLAAVRERAASVENGELREALTRFGAAFYTAKKSA